MRGALVRPAPVARLRLSAVRRRGPVRWPHGGLAVRLSWLAAWLAAAGALIPIALYGWAVAHRIGFGYEFDWLENGAVELVARVTEGKSLYAPPSLAYVAYPYTPLYAWVSAAVAEVIGVGFLPLRIVSVASSLVVFGALWKLVVGATGDRAAGWVGVGLFAATYGLTGWWFDVGRTDSLFLALTLVTLWLGRDAASPRAGVVLGGVAFLAFFTKQVALLAVAPALAVLLFTQWRAAVVALVTLAVLLLGSTLVLDATSGGWYRYYVVSELSGQAWNPLEWKDFWRIDLYRHLRPEALVMLLAAVAGARGTWRARRTPPYLYELAAAAGLLAAAWVSRLHTGGYLNVLMPAYAATAMLGGIAFASLHQRGAVATLVAAALVVVQMTGLIGSFHGAIPTPAESASGDALIAGLRSLPGPVLILGNPWYGTLTGKGTFAQQDAIEEVVRSQSPRGRIYLERNLSGALNRYDIRTVVLDGQPPNWLAPQLRRDFTLRPGSLTRSRLRGFGGVETLPTSVYLRRSSGRP